MDTFNFLINKCVNFSHVNIYILYIKFIKSVVLIHLFFNLIPLNLINKIYNFFILIKIIINIEEQQIDDAAKRRNFIV